MEICPLCGGKQTGKVGNDQFFCSSCFVEFNSQKKIFEINEDGTLTELTL